MKVTTLLPFLALSATAVSAFDRLIAFADSLTDNGNDYSITKFPPHPYWSGRFTNGPTWLEHVDMNLLDNEVLNRADAGASTNSEDVQYVINDFFVPGLQQKILTSNVKGTPEDLYLIYIGYNDLNAIVNPDQYIVLNKDYNIQKISDNVVKSAELLIKMYGAKDFLIMNVVPFDQFPNVQDKDKPFAKKLINDYNALVKSELPKKVPGANFKFLDDHAWFAKQLKNPSKLGVKTSNGPCAWGVGNTTACDDPEKHFFWDSAHPTKEVHAAFGAWVTQQIKSMYKL